METNKSIYNRWISKEEWETMSHSQYAWEFCVVELIYEIGYMGAHIVCIVWDDNTIRTDCDGRIINIDKIAAIMFIEPFNKQLKK